MERVAAEPAQRMNQDEVERMIGFPGGEDHFLKNGAILVKCRRARLGIDLDDFYDVPLAPRPALCDLVGQRKIVLRLPDGGSAGIHNGSEHGRTISKKDSV